MNRAFATLAAGVPNGDSAVGRFIDEYYFSNQHTEGIVSLNSYCDLFRKQMAIVVAAPVLLCMKMTGDSYFAGQIESAFGSFGIAWRLLDDVQDISEDIETGSESSVYFCLTERLKSEWKTCGVEIRDGTRPAVIRILSHILEGRFIDDIKARICAELRVASSAATACNMIGLAEEFQCLTLPLDNFRGAEEERNGT